MSKKEHGPRTPPTPYNAQFDATYSPEGLQTSSTWGGGYGRGGHGGGGYGYESESSFDPTALMDIVYKYKQRGADAALERQQKGERDARVVGRFQAQALRNNTPPMRQTDPALNAAVMRAQAQHSSMMGATPFNPAGAIADYYQYSRGGK